MALKDGGLDAGCPVANYAAPTGVSGSYGYDIKDDTYGHPYYKDDVIACADADLYGTTNPLLFDSSVITPSSTDKFTKLVTHQLLLADDTEFGEKGELATFIRWQEI